VLDRGECGCVRGPGGCDHGGLCRLAGAAVSADPTGQLAKLREEALLAAATPADGVVMLDAARARRTAMQERAL